jgi:hypothetical protein
MLEKFFKKESNSDAAILNNLEKSVQVIAEATEGMVQVETRQDKSGNANAVFRTNTNFTKEQNLAMLESFSKVSQVPLFKGVIEHAYESAFTGYKDKCPRCSAATELRMSNFVYACQHKERVMTAPAGHFCTKCPTVVIDDEFMEANMDASQDIEYGGVVMIDSVYDKPSLFKTLNGEKSTYIADQDQNLKGIAQSVHKLDAHDTYDVLSSNGNPTKLIAAKKKKAKNKSRNKAAKQSRRNNRK